MNLGLLIFTVFLVLKLTHTVNWSWLWVTSPLWLPMAFIICFFVLMVLFAILCAIISAL